ncbi:MAG: PQQ-like beta-propeller repeat protein [Fimbriimonadia bacterium]
MFGPLDARGVAPALVAAALLLPPPTLGQPVPNAPWPMMGHDARHTGRTTVVPANPALRGTIKWIYDPNDTHNDPDEVDAIHAGAAIGPDGKLFFGTTHGRFICLNKATGQRLWSYPPPSQPPASAHEQGVYGTPALGVAYSAGGDGLDGPPGQELYNVYFTTDDGRLWCFRADGSLVWIRQVGEAIGGSPVIGSNGRIYVAWSNGATRKAYVSAYDAAGTSKWVQELPAHPTQLVGVIAGPAVGDNGTVYVGDTLGRLHAVVDRGTYGELKWPNPYKNPAGAPGVHCEPVIGDDGTIYYTTFYQQVGNGLHAVVDNGLYQAPSSKWHHDTYMPLDFLTSVAGPLGLEAVDPVEGGPFLDWTAEGARIWFGTFVGGPSRFIRVEECTEPGDPPPRWAEGVVVTDHPLINNVDAVGACARWYDAEGRMQQAIVIAYEEPIVYSFRLEAHFPAPVYWWRLLYPTFPDTIERPQLSIDSDGTVYVGSSHPRYRSGRLFAIWGP